jgi:predicted Zn-ribbon and HTH transcriptional regulator
MTGHHYMCEDCGYVFDEVIVDIEEGPLACPECEGLDIQLLKETEPDSA